VNKLIGVLLLFAVPLYAQPPSPRMRPQPKPLFQRDADIKIENQEILTDCAEAQLCVQGNIKNVGGKPASSVKIRVEIGNTQMAKPRVVKIFPVESSTMNPGDQQEFWFKLDRKTLYKDHKGKPKVMEVGKYNFRVIPIWSGKKTTR
jgi:hypothetical protein